MLPATPLDLAGDVGELASQVVTASRRSRAGLGAVPIPMYGRAGVAEAWVVDLNTETVEIWTEPGPHGYAATRRAGRGDELDVAGVTVTVDEILG